MSNKFTVIKATLHEKNMESKRILHMDKMSEYWENQFDKMVSQQRANGYKDLRESSQDELVKLCIAGVKCICLCREVEKENVRSGVISRKTILSLADDTIKFNMLSYIICALGCLTTKAFVNTFPITKKYDGDKWDCKDYFYSMHILSFLDWNKPIGREKIEDLIWDYQNEDLKEMYIEYLCTVSKLYRMQTGKGIAEKFCEDNGIGTYTVNNETGTIKDNQTGHTMKLKKRSNIQIVK